MIDTLAPRVPLTVQLPAELILEMQVRAKERQVSLDEVILDACLEYMEPWGWERAYQNWQQNRQNDTTHEPDKNGHPQRATSHEEIPS